MSNKTALMLLLVLIPTAAEIKTAIFENDMDEKMLDEWLFERIFKDKPFLEIEKSQIIDAYMVQFSNDPKRMEDAEQYYNETFTTKK